jgi:hypothetical protein
VLRSAESIFALNVTVIMAASSKSLIASSNDGYLALEIRDIFSCDARK